VSRQIFQIYLGIDEVSPDHANKILGKINSLNSVEAVMDVIETHTGPSSFAVGTAQRIVEAKMKMGKFQNLNQIAIMPGIGRKKFGLLVSAFGDTS
jgi:hypothetical protein